MEGERVEGGRRGRVRIWVRIRRERGKEGRWEEREREEQETVKLQHLAKKVFSHQ